MLRLISEKQLAANRANALRSTGPRTPEGKARSSRNASKHGLTSVHAPATPEDLEELTRLTRDLHAFYRPINTQEQFALDRIAQARQAILRASRLESGLIAACSKGGRGLGEGFHRMAQQSNAWALFLRYQAQAERNYRRAIEEFDRLKALRQELPNQPILASQPQQNERQAAAEPAIGQAAPPAAPLPQPLNIASTPPLAGKWNRPLPPSSYARSDQRAWRATAQS